MHNFDINSLIYYSKFLENGGNKSGFVLKPAFTKSGFSSLYISQLKLIYNNSKYYK